MNRRQLVRGAAGLAVVAQAARVRAAAGADALSARTRKLLRESLIVDLCGANSPIHAISMQPVHYDSWIAKYRKAGVTWLSMTVGTDFTKTTGRMLHVLAANRRYILERPDEYVFIHTAADVARAKAEGKLGVNFNFQGSNPLEGDANLVELLHALGVGHMLLAYNDKNLAAGGSHDHDNPGLSNFGRALVAEMNRVGMVCDGSHMSARSTLEMCEASMAPVIFSHSCARALRDHERNIGDDQIKAAAATGGVIGVNGVSLFLSEALYDPSAQHMFRHIDYIAELVGDAHVGLGLDHVPGMDAPLPVDNVVPQYTELYGEEQYPPINRLAIAGPSVIAPLTEEMVRHGYTDEQVRGILGENFLRVFRDVRG